MSHLQPCCETLTLRHAWLRLRDKRMTAGRINQVHCDHFSVHACKRESRERERERERGQREGGREGGADDPRRQRRKKRHVQNMCPACTGTGSQSGILSPSGRKNKKRHPGRPPENEGGGGGEEEGEREKERKKHRNPERKTTPEKNPAAFSDQNQSKTQYPNY